MSGGGLVMSMLQDYGEREVVGPGSNPRIGDFLESVGLGRNDETAWCSACMYYHAGRAGYERPARQKAPAARSWLDVGEAVLEPEIGDVVVLRRGDSVESWQAHVGIYVRTAGSQVYVLGGNQSNAVSIQPYYLGKVLGYRRLKRVTRIPGAPK